MAKDEPQYTGVPPEASGPEVVQSNGADGMIPVPKTVPDTESPQVYDPHYQQQQYFGQQSPPGYNPSQAYSQNGYSSSLDHSNNEKLAGAGVAPVTSSHSSNPARRKRLVWIIIGAILLALAVGLGVGLGVGLSQNDSNNDSQTANQSQGNSQSSNNGTSSATTTASTTASTTATATSSAVTSGSTGLAEFSCNSTETTESEGGTPYIQECYTQFQTGHSSYYAVNDNITMKNLGGKITVYTFQGCLDQCDDWNTQGNTPACRAVTYYANLTAPIQMWGGNCFLKNDRGNGYQTDPVDYSHTASAFQSCLNQTCWGEN